MLEEKYKPLPQGSEIPDERLGLETLKRTLEDEVRYLEDSQRDKNAHLKRAHYAQVSEEKTLRRINILKETIDKLLISLG